MKKWLYLTSAVVLVATPAFAKDVKRVISPEQLFQEAKKQCPARATSPEGWAEIRRCIAEAKEKIILSKDPRASSTCGKYSGDDRSNCVDWVYTRGSTNWTPSIHAEREGLRSNLQKNYTLPPENPNILQQGRQHEQTERQMIDRAMGNNPRSNQSTITGIGRGGSQVNKGGIELGGEVTGQPSDLGGIHDAIKELPQ